MEHFWAKHINNYSPYILKWIKDWVLQLLLIQLKRSSAHAFYQQLYIKMDLKLLKSLALIPES